MDQIDVDAHLDYIRTEVRRCQVRWTEQRAVIVEQFIKRPGHHVVEDFYELIKRQDESISMATVYRTFNLLVDIGVAVKRVFGDGAGTFEYIHKRDHHDHLIDVESGEIIEFVNDEIEVLQKMVAKQLGFELHDHRLVLYGRKRSEV